MRHLLFVFGLFSIIGVGILFFSGITGMVQYGGVVQVEVPDETVSRAQMGVLGVIDSRALLTHEQAVASARVASYQRAVSPKKAPEKSPSQLPGTGYCRKRSGEEGRVYLLKNVKRSGQGQGCELLFDLNGNPYPYAYCCNAKISGKPRPWE